MQKIIGLAALGLVYAAEDDRRLVVVNGCNSGPIWLAHTVASAVGPDPRDVKIAPGARASFQTGVGSGGLSATRYWAKMGCDSSGNKCSIGDSGGPGEGCVIRIPGKADNYSNCAPPIDTKFEATFVPPDQPTMDTVDMSLVDGYSLPFKLEVAGGNCTRHHTDTGPAEPFSEMDCSGLSLSRCPTGETINGNTVSLQATDPKTGKVAGCYSPCLRLTDDKWQKDAPVAPDSPQASPFCCAGVDGSPAACQAGPILKTEYVKSVHDSCVGAYGYAFDDKTSTIVCTTSTQYTLTFYCPTADTEVVVV